MSTRVAKQMAAGVRGRDDITGRLLDRRTTAMLGDRCKMSPGGRLVTWGTPVESAEPPGPWGHLLSPNTAEVLWF